MPSGTIKFINTGKGFGFIAVDDLDRDIYFHSSGLLETVKEKDRVSFDIGVGRKGQMAVNVRVLALQPE